MTELCAWHWFWALTRWKFFLAERTYHQAMLVFRVPRDLPHWISCPKMILDDPDYAIGSIKGVLQRPQIMTAGS